MKTVSTKLDNSTHKEFLEMCNQDGVCVSEMLRDMVEGLIDSEKEPNPSATTDTAPTETKPIPKVIVEQVFD